jgi:hypothetical protein
VTGEVIGQRLLELRAAPKWLRKKGQSKGGTDGPGGCLGVHPKPAPRTGGSFKTLFRPIPRTTPCRFAIYVLQATAFYWNLL